MIPDKAVISRMASDKGATGSAVFSVSEIKFSDVYRKMCQQNLCGSYGKNYMCPPAVGELDTLIAKVRGYESCLLIQTVTPLEDSFDFEGMEKAAQLHKKVLDDISEVFRSEYGAGDFIKLGVGKCTICGECAILTGEPCRFPDEAISSVEAYGMDVRKLCEEHGLKYINGQDTVSYVGMIVY
ncbi:MAG: DUF2284 domain-containing protein [Eubacteriales bacterium]